MCLKNAIFKWTKFDHLIADHVEFLFSFLQRLNFWIHLNYAIVVDFEIIHDCLELLCLFYCYLLFHCLD